MTTRFFITLFLAVTLRLGAVNTEFYVVPTGSNLNGGSGTNTTAAYTSVNGNWNGTSIFTPTDGSTPASTVNVGDFASVYLDGATVGVYVARVTVVAAGVNGAITLSTTAFSGTAPTSSATGRSIKVGGAWKGPNAAEAFPFGFVTSALTDASGNIPRVNLKGGTNYAVTAGITHANAGPIVWQGYTTTVGDQGKATIDGGTSGASYTVITTSCANNSFLDLIWSNNGATGNADLVIDSGVENLFTRCVFHDSRGTGILFSGTGGAVSCEAYANGKNNSTTKAGFGCTSQGTHFISCITHDNTGSNTSGFNIGAATYMIFCISDTNGKDGVTYTGILGGLVMMGCDVYNNGAAGLDMTGASGTFLDMQNCNFLKNTTWAVTSSGSALRNGRIRNCGFGTGTQANGSGNVDTNVGGIVVNSSVNYASGVTPWVDPANGDFRINLAASKSTGYGVFTETAASYTGTVAYPDIGAAQHQDSPPGYAFPFVQ